LWQGCHLALFETVCQKRNGLPFGHFLPLLNVDKNSIFLGFFGQIWANFEQFMKFEILFSYLNIFFEGNFALILPFFIFQDLAFFETTYCQIWPF
jgi:hypothetical protein